jgi:ABC-type spermidine/putrescine transport system permease subunit II
VSGGARDPSAADFLWLLLPLAVLAAFSGGAQPAGLAVGFALYFVGPLLGRLTMLAKGRSVRAGLLVAALFPILGLLALLALENRRR